MASEHEAHVTLEDLASDRRGFSEARARLKTRALWEWLIGGTAFSAIFSLAVWLLRPNTPTIAYEILVVASYTVAAFAVFMNMQKASEWYRGKAAELDSVERRIRAGERVLRPNPTIERDARKTRARPSL